MTTVIASDAGTGQESAVLNVSDIDAAAGADTGVLALWIVLGADAGTGIDFHGTGGSGDVAAELDLYVIEHQVDQEVTAAELVLLAVPVS